MKPDRKQMMDERKSLMREFRQVRQAMSMKKEKPEKGKLEKHDVDPREVLMEIRNQMFVRKKERPAVFSSVVVIEDNHSGIAIPFIGEA
jgi:hypothetical protein